MELSRTLRCHVDCIASEFHLKAQISLAYAGFVTIRILPAGTKSDVAAGKLMESHVRESEEVINKKLEEI